MPQSLSLHLTQSPCSVTRGPLQWEVHTLLISTKETLPQRPRVANKFINKLKKKNHRVTSTQNMILQKLKQMSRSLSRYLISTPLKIQLKSNLSNLHWQLFLQKLPLGLPHLPPGMNHISKLRETTHNTFYRRISRSLTTKNADNCLLKMTQVKRIQKCGSTKEFMSLGRNSSALGLNLLNEPEILKNTFAAILTYGPENVTKWQALYPLAFTFLNCSEVWLKMAF